MSLFFSRDVLLRYVAGGVLAVVVLVLCILWILLACSGCAFTTAGAKEIALAVADRVLDSGTTKIVQAVKDIIPPPEGGHGDTQELVAIGLSAAAVIGHRYFYHRNGKHGNDSVRSVKQ